MPLSGLLVVSGCLGPLVSSLGPVSSLKEATAQGTVPKTGFSTGTHFTARAITIYLAVGLVEFTVPHLSDTNLVFDGAY